MKKRFLAILLALSMINVPYAGTYAEEAGFNNELVASDGDAESADAYTQQDTADNVGASTEQSDVTDDGEAAVVASGYIDDGERIDGYEPTDDTPMLYSSAIPASYDSRDYGEVTSVKNQNPYGTCWAFAALASGESSLISQGYYTASNIDLSEYHLAYFFYNSQTDPLGNLDGDRTYLNSSYNYNYLTVGGNNYLTMFALATWRGAADEDTAPYGNASATSVLDSSLAFDDIAHLQNVRIASIKDNPDDVKKLIMEYGAVASGMYFDTSSDYYDSSTSGYYNSKHSSSNHAITIVGWDDNFSFDSFSGSSKPSGKGAWIVKNSWGDSNIPYIYVSYYDASISNQDAFAYIMETADNYDNNYQYDGTYINAYGIIPNGSSLANVYTVSASDAEEIKAVSIALRSDNVKYSLQIYKNPDEGNPKSGEAMLGDEVTGQTTYAGYYTVKLPESLKVSEGDTFSVVFTLTDVDSANVEYYIDQSTASAYMEKNQILFESHCEEGQSYYINDSIGYVQDFASGSSPYCARIKAFTDDVEVTEPEPTPVVPISSCDVSPIGTYYYTGQAVTPSVAVTYNGSTLKQNTDYTVSYENNVNPGTATVKITGAGNYSGTKTISFSILAKSSPATVYNGVDYSAVYDYNYYVTKYSDIWKAFGTDDKAVLAHFVSYGMNEGRQAKSTFDVYSYAYRYRDLRSAYKNNLKSYYMHYINYGRNEGRTATGVTSIQNCVTTYNGVDYSAVYDGNYYWSKYSDLRKAYGLDDDALLKHFVNYGMSEGRQGKSTFEVYSYAYKYRDLRSAYKNNLKSYYMHYINYGKKEGRTATGVTSIQNCVTTYNGVNYSAVYDGAYYWSKYSDLRKTYGLDDDALLKHFVNYGMSEGRQGESTFNVITYKNRYADLQKVFGSNLKSYYIHYIQYGIKEGRKGI